jgi:hypothetical protein
VYKNRTRQPGRVPSWSWRGSNPRPYMEVICFLHAYPCLIVGTCQLQGNLADPYFLFVSPSDRNNLQASPGLRAPPYRVGSGLDRPGDVSSRHMCQEILPFGKKCLSYFYSLMLRERNCFRLLLFCDTVQVTRHHTLHAYITPLMLSKPCQPHVVLESAKIHNFFLKSNLSNAHAMSLSQNKLKEG